MEELTRIFNKPHSAVAYLRGLNSDDQGYNAMKQYAEEIFGDRLFLDLLDPTLANVRACFVTAFLNEKNRIK